MIHFSLSKHRSTCALASIALMAAASAAAQTVNISTFATGSGVNATNPDSIASLGESLWVSYTNSTTGTGTGGYSTVVHYSLSGAVKHVYSFLGSVDGLKIDPANGTVWVLHNQDGNSTLTLINGKSHHVSAPIPYAVPSTANGYDDAVFRYGQVFESYTNPASPSDPTIQLVQKGSNPLVVTPVLLKGATGTNLATGQTNQPTSQNDPDSLKITPNGDLMLTSGDDGQLVFVSQPGTKSQSVSFLQLLDASSGTPLPVSGLDDAIFATSAEGTMFLADTKNNRILKLTSSDLPEGSLYACVGSVNALVSVDKHTGIVTPLVSGLNGPHGLVFLPDTGDQD